MVANNQRGRHQGEQLVAVLHPGKMPCGCPLYLQSGHWNPVAKCPLCAMNGLVHHSKKRPYSMTSSEIASTLAGMSKPSALAVLRLITSGYLIDCITGKSAGFMPLRIFAA